MDTAVIIGVVVAVAIVILVTLIILAVLITVLVCTKYKGTSESSMEMTTVGEGIGVRVVRGSTA